MLIHLNMYIGNKGHLKKTYRIIKHVKFIHSLSDGD